MLFVYNLNLTNDATVRVGRYLRTDLPIYLPTYSSWIKAGVGLRDESHRILSEELRQIKNLVSLLPVNLSFLSFSRFNGHPGGYRDFWILWETSRSKRQGWERHAENDAVCFPHHCTNPNGRDQELRVPWRQGRYRPLLSTHSESGTGRRGGCATAWADQRAFLASCPHQYRSLTVNC